MAVHFAASEVLDVVPLGVTRTIKSTIQNIYLAKDFDFRLKPGSAAVERGVTLPNVTDGFAGAAPDLGAFEVGMALLHHGPRP